MDTESHKARMEEIQKRKAERTETNEFRAKCADSIAQTGDKCYNIV